MDNDLKVHIGYYNAFEDEMVIIKDLESKYVSDGITEDECSRWMSQNPIFISAQTGAGKNYFIENMFIKNAMGTNNKILIISNRLCTNRQEKIRIIHLTGCDEYLDDYTPKGLDKIEYFKNVRIVTYQKLGSYVNNFLKLEELKQYSTVCFDEAHYFLSDSLFNAATGYILKKSVQIFKKSLRIYITATPDEVFSSILKEEKKLDCNPAYILNQQLNYYTVFPRRLLYYRSLALKKFLGR